MNAFPRPLSFTSATLLAILLSIGATPLRAQDSIALREIRDLRAMVEKQSKQIDVLSEQIARLNSMLTNKNEAGTPAAVAVAVPAAPTAGEFSADTPKAEAPDGKRHVVIKGETLTSIAKHYNLPLPELQKANKAVDERKLQIGQTLIIPPSVTTETPAEKKENP